MKINEGKRLHPQKKNPEIPGGDLRMGPEDRLLPIKKEEEQIVSRRTAMGLIALAGLTGVLSIHELAKREEKRKNAGKPNDLQSGRANSRER